jgi:glycosyltransferase 2 family protein
MKRNGLIKIALTVILFIVLLVRLDLHELMITFLGLDLRYLLISLVLVPTLYVIRTYRWNVLLSSLGIEKTFRGLFKALLVGVFYGLITPGKVGELARAYYLDEKKSLTISTILMEKLVDVIVLSVLSAITIIFFFYNYAMFSYIIFASASASILGIWLLTNKSFLAFITKPLNIGCDDMERHIDSFAKLRNDRCAMSKTVILAFLYYSVNYICAILILLSLGADTFLFVTLPLVILIGNVPITISGLGMRESVGVICFVLLGGSGVQGFLFSLLLFIITTLIPGIIGYALIMSQKNVIPRNLIQDVMK